jgi:hypothetical protein
VDGGDNGWVRQRWRDGRFQNTRQTKHEGKERTVELEIYCLASPQALPAMRHICLLTLHCPATGFGDVRQTSPPWLAPQETDTEGHQHRVAKGRRTVRASSLASKSRSQAISTSRWSRCPSSRQTGISLPATWGKTTSWAAQEPLRDSVWVVAQHSTAQHD